MQRCPDHGFCHHDCAELGTLCWRVAHCGPLSKVYDNDEWPDDVLLKHAPFEVARRLQRLEDAVEIAAQGIYKNCEGYWPSDYERHRLACALIEVEQRRLTT